jgi:hypothetical protein
MIGWILAWLIVGSAIGHADAVRLLAASAFVRSARYLTSPESGASLRMRLDAAGRVPASARATAILVEVAALIGSLALVGAIIALLLHIGERETASFCLVLAGLLPARLLSPIIAVKQTSGLYQPMLAVAGLILAALVWLVNGSALWFAASFAARDWIVALIVWWIAKPREAAEQQAERLHWREIADHSHFHGRRRFTYRVSKSLLKFMFGPVGSFAARTGRGFRIDHALERFVPRRTLSLAALFLVLSGAAVALILIVPKPGVQLLAASLLRVGASAGNILIWSKLGRGDVVLSDDEDDED